MTQEESGNNGSYFLHGGRKSLVEVSSAEETIGLPSSLSIKLTKASEETTVVKANNIRLAQLDLPSGLTERHIY